MTVTVLGEAAGSARNRARVAYMTQAELGLLRI